MSISRDQVKDDFYRTMYAPEVNEEFVEKWAKEIKLYRVLGSSGMGGECELIGVSIPRLKDMLREAGVVVKEGK